MNNIKQTLIIPVAGIRKTDSLPYLFDRTPYGEILLIENIRSLPLNSFSKIIIVIQKEIEETFHIKEILTSEFPKLQFTGEIIISILMNKTKNEPETVATAIKENNVSGPIMIKDADNIFNCEPYVGNGICVFPLDKMEDVTPSIKSYVQIDDSQYIANIIEKKIISRFFCTGGYFFENAEEFSHYFNKIPSSNQLFISHVIFTMLLEKKVFRPVKVKEYLDLGNKKKWDDYKKRFKNIYVDFQFTISNTDRIKEISENKYIKLIVTSSYYSQEYIREKLYQKKIKYHAILCELFSEQQLFITDMKEFQRI